MLKIGVLGCGRIGVMPAANIAAHPRAAVAGLYDVNRAGADALGAKLGAKVFDSAAVRTVKTNEIG